MSEPHPNMLKTTQWCKRVAVFLLLMSFVSCKRHTSIAPYAVVPQTTYNFSQIYTGEQVAHDFYIKNDGETPLQIEGIMSTCRCIFARVSNRQVSPHSEVVLKVTLNTDGINGAIDHKIMVYTNAVNERTLTFTVKGYVKQLFSLQPASVDFEKVSSNSSPSRNIVFTSTSIAITSVTSSSPYIKAVLNKQTQNRYDIGLRLVRELPAGVLNGDILIFTTSSRFPVLRVPVKARKDSDLQANPDEIYGGVLIKGQTSTTFNTYVFSKHRMPYRIKKVYDTNNFLNIAFDRLAPDVYKIEVSAKPFEQEGEYTSDILIVTTDPKTPLLQIPYRVMIMNH